MLRKPHCYSVVVLWLLTTTVLAAPPEGKGKDKPPEEPVELPNIRYSITMRSMPAGSIFDVTNINNAGVLSGYVREVVGEPRDGFVYVPPSTDQPNGVFYNLNQLGLQPKLDALTQPVGWGTGWAFSVILEVNDLGDFVGCIYPPDLSGNKGVLVETSSSPDPGDPATWTIRLLPSFGSDDEAGIDLNELGVVLGQYQRPDGTLEMYLYDSHAPEGADNPQTLNLPDAGWGSGMLNNFGKVVGAATGISFNNLFFEYDPLISPDVELYQLGDYQDLGSNFNGLNDSGDTSGKTYLELPKAKGKGTTIEVVIFNTNALDVAAVGDVHTYAFGRAGINESGDIHFRSGYEIKIAHLAHTGFPAGDSLQVWKLNDLIDENDPLRDQWMQLSQTVLGITNRDTTGYPTLAGYVKDEENGNREIFVLRPFAPEP